MESYPDISKDSSSSSASYSYLSNSSAHSLNYDNYQPETNSRKPPPPFRSALHSVRKFPAKNIITKKPIAPLPPTRPKIYKVDPLEFKDVVQKLTAARNFQQTRLQEVAPPPLRLSQPLPEEEGSEKRRKSTESTFGVISPLGFSLSPASLAWCSSVLLSPGTLATFEPSAVL